MRRSFAPSWRTSRRTPDIRGIHEKAILEATLFGLPMFGVVMPAGREDVPGTGGPITATRVTAEPAFSLGLAAANLHLGSPADFVLTAKELPLKNPPYDAVPGTFTTAKWLSGPNGVVTNPAEPAVPLVARNATSTDADHVLRGVGFRGGTYTDTANIVPLTGAPTTELRGVHAPFSSPVFYPMRLWSPNYFGALGGQRRDEPARDACPAQERPGQPGQEHPAQVHRPGSAALLQRQPDLGRVVRRPDHRRSPDRDRPRRA